MHPIMEWQVKPNPSTPVSRQKNYRPVQIDKLISRIAEKLDFAFEVVVAPRGMYGKKESSSGEWDGLIGDLARGETDLVVADLTMTSEREEVIDFVSPYFDQESVQQSPIGSVFIGLQSDSAGKKNSEKNVRFSFS